MPPAEELPLCVSVAPSTTAVGSLMILGKTSTGMFLKRPPICLLNPHLLVKTKGQKRLILPSHPDTAPRKPGSQRSGPLLSALFSGEHLKPKRSNSQHFCLPSSTREASRSSKAAAPAWSSMPLPKPSQNLGKSVQVLTLTLHSESSDSSVPHLICVRLGC